MADTTGQTPSYEYSFFDKTLVSFFKFVNRFISWDKLPGPIGVIVSFLSEEFRAR